MRWARPGWDFVDPPDFDRPADSNRDNLYRVAVNAFDGETTATFDVSVTVADTDEDGAVSLWPRQPQAGSRLTAELDDPDGETGVAWLWERLDPLTGWTQINRRHVRAPTHPWRATRACCCG